MSPFGIILAAVDEITRRASALPSASAADLSLIANRLDHAAAQVRTIALCREAEGRPRVTRLPVSSLRRSA